VECRKHSYGHAATLGQRKSDAHSRNKQMQTAIAA
jgi:hypothetical protein